MEYPMYLIDTQLRAIFRQLTYLVGHFTEAGRFGAHWMNPLIGHFTEVGAMAHTGLISLSN